MVKPPKDIHAALVEARSLWRGAVQVEDRRAEAFAMRRLDEALDAWNRRLELAAEYAAQPEAVEPAGDQP